jgi:soluble lytic murein transglycosylase-like protein
MPNIAALSNEVKGLPDQALRWAAQGQNALLPSYVALGELQRRQLTRQAVEKEQTQGQSSTVLQDVIRAMMVRQPAMQGLPAPPAGMVPMGNSQSSMPGGAPPQNFAAPVRAAKGGVLKFDIGGSADQANPPSDYSDYMAQKEQEAGLQPGLLHALMMQESGGNPNAVGEKITNPKSPHYGERAAGAFQFMPSTARQYGITNPFDMKQSIDGATAYLKDLYGRFGGDLDNMLHGYYGWGRQPKGQPTWQDYVAQVKRRMPQQEAQKIVQAGKNLVGAPDLQTPAEQKQAASSPQTPEIAAPTPQEQPAEDQTPAPGPEPSLQIAGATEPVIAGSQTAATPAAQPAAPSPMNDIVQRLLTESLSRKAQLAGLYQQAYQRYNNTDIWSYLSNLGAGMADSHQISGPLMFAHGVGVAQQAEDARRQQALQDLIALGGESDKIDKGLFDLQHGAQLESFRNLAKAGVYGAANAPPFANATFTPDPGDPAHGVWTPPAQMRVTPGMIPYLGENPDTGKPYEAGEMISGQLATQALDAEKGVALKKAEQKGQGLTSIGVAAISLGIDPNNMTQAQAKQLQEVLKPTVDLTPGEIDQYAQLYRQTKTLPNFGFGTAGVKARQAILARAADMSSDSLAADIATGTADTALLKSLNERIGAVDAFEGTAGANLDLMLNAGKKIIDSGSPWINKPLREIDQKTLGAADLAAYNAARQVALTEIAKVTGNPTLAGTLTDSQRSEVMGLIPGEATLAQVYSVAKILKQDMFNRRDFLQKEYDKVRQRLNAPAGINNAPAGGGTSTTGANAPPNAVPARPSGIPADASAQYNPGLQQWRFKPKGSDQWQPYQPQ